MAKKERQFRLYNRIWFPIVTLLLVIATIWGTVGSFMPSTMALEQDARCQMEEHVHTDACYLDTVLICDKKAHTHSESCYLVLLKDNDINNLLTAVDNTEGNSLEGAIQTTLTQALAADGVSTDREETLTFVGGTEPSASPSPTPTPTPASTSTPDPSPSTTRGEEDPQPSTTRGEEDPQPSTTRGDTVEEDTEAENPVAVLSLTGTSLTALNDTIAENGIEPALTLNTSLYAVNAVAEELNSGISTLAVGGTPSTGTRRVNFYFLLDGVVTYVNGGILSDRNSYDYYSYNNTVNAYKNTAGVITDLSTSNIGRSRFFRYNTSGTTTSPSNFNSTPTYQSSQIRMGNNSNTRYAILVNSSGNAINFWTVTLDYSQVGGTDTVRYVQDGLSSGLTANSQYDWYASPTATTPMEAAEITTALSNIKNTTTLYAKPKALTVTWIYPGDAAPATDSETPTNGSATFNVPDLSAYGDYVWVDSTGALVAGDTVTVNANTTYRAVEKYRTITYRYADDTPDTVVQAEYGKPYTLLEAPVGQVWFSGTDIYAGTIDPVTSDLELHAGVVATFSYLDDTVVRIPAKPGDTITLPADNLSEGGYWMDDQSNEYAGGDSYVLNESTGFVENRSLILSYDVDFPTSGYNFQYTVYAPAASPTVFGMTGSTGSVTVLPGGETTVRTVSQAIVRLETAHAFDFTYPVVFKGWESETGELINAHSRLSWAELQSYDENSDGTVELTGVWDHGRTDAVNFFVLYNADVGSTDGSSGNYTPSIYSTFMGNPNTTKSPLYTATTDAQALANDPLIRDMYGERANDMWFYTFPTDDEVFAALGAHVNNLTVDNVAVKAEDLNSNEYAIRWYKVLYDGGDGWHVDGKLVRKVGAIEVTKTFSGNDTLIAAAQSGFTITAHNGTKTTAATKSHTLNTLAYNDTSNPNGYRAYDAATHTYTWQISGVEYNEQWTLTESAQVADTLHYAEWAITDASANSQTSNGNGNSVTVRGTTFASDLADPEWLQVGFNNIYYRENSLMIKKADGTTGEALTGARFRLYQGGQLMTFDYDSATGLYQFNSGGTGAYDTLACDGYVNIATTGFSYDTGPITVVEVTAPTNYNPVGSIVVGYTDSTNSTIGITNNVDYAEYHDGLLVVKNSTNTLNVTAKKSWECAESEWRDITVQLFANGSANLAATLTGSSSTVAVLTAANDYRYTWTNLPIYAYGTKVEWSIKETQIGDEACKADYTFANWAVSYDAPTYDSNGNVTLVVHNTPSRPLLFLTKTNADGSLQLSGATFTLVQVNASGNIVSGFVPRTATTNENGVLIFDNLLYGARYRIVEETPPSGYRPLTEPIYLTIAEGGVITVESHTHARADAVAYNIVVTNDSYPPLPATGGSGTQIYTRTGALLMAAALLLLVYEKRRRREGFPDA